MSNHPIALVFSVLLLTLCLGFDSLCPANTTAALDTVIDQVQFDNEPADRALQWLNTAANLNMVVAWHHLEAQGIDRQAPITLNLKSVQARTVLKLIVSQLSEDDSVVVQVNPDYIHVRTKEQANNDPVVRIYPIQDLLHEVPYFNNAPQFDLNQIASDSDGGGQTIFEDQADEVEKSLPRSERANQIADAIRASIEPDIWEENGGRGGKITYLNGMLIIRAPLYVHRRIGIPGMDSLQGTSTGVISEAPRPIYHPAYDPRSFSPGYSTRDAFNTYHPVRHSNGVSGIDMTQTSRY